MDSNRQAPRRAAQERRCRPREEHRQDGEGDHVCAAEEDDEQGEYVEHHQSEPEAVGVVRVVFGLGCLFKVGVVF